MPLLPYLDGGTPNRPRGVPSLPVGQGAQAFAQALQDVSRATQHIFEVNERATMRDELASAAIAINNAQDEIQASGDFKGAEEQFAKVLEEQRTRSTKLRGVYADEFQQQLKVLGAGESLRLRSWAREEAARDTRARLDSSTAKWVEMFARTGETTYFDQAMQEVDAAKGTALSPEQHQAAREQILARAVEDRGAALIQQNPAVAEYAFTHDPFFKQEGVREAQRSKLIEAAQAEGRERQAAAHQEVLWREHLQAKEEERINAENTERVLEGTLSPQEVYALPWATTAGRVYGMALDRQLRAQERGQPRQTDWAYYGQLQQIAVSNPQALRTTPIDVSRLSDTDARTWMGFQRSVRDPKADLGTVFSPQQEAVFTWKQIKTTGWFDGRSDLDESQAGQFYALFNQRYAEQVRLSGKKLDAQQLETLKRGVAAEFVAQVGAGTPLAPAIVVPPTDDIRKQIEAGIRANGLPVTDAEVDRRYRAWLEQ